MLIFCLLKEELIEKVGNSVRLVEVWEAKSTIYPATLEDALSKKYRAVSVITDSDVELSMEGERFPVDDTHPPTIGVFGRVDRRRIHHRYAAAMAGDHGGTVLWRDLL